MTLPDENLIAAGLKRWREIHGWSTEYIAAQSKTRSKAPFTKVCVNRWENGTTKLVYQRLQSDILPAYQIDDWDTFVDFCTPATLESITIIEKAHFTTSPLDTGTIDEYLNSGFLRTHRTRIDRIIFRPGTEKATPWGTHLGHEFVLILRGVVVAQFGSSHDGRLVSHNLSAGMAIAFPSSLNHRFLNASPLEEAELVAARPTNSGTANNKLQLVLV